jgi:asparagine synthase (glutamine-hydrolysing)
VCGIAGFDRVRDAEGAGRSLQAALANRGPDGAWSRSVGRYCLVQTRLAVIDLSPRVTYPMCNESRDLWLLFNGEIYGYPDVRDELETRGHCFSTDCDAEVVVHAYEEWGIDAFARLNGMFALALVDERRDEIVLTRDSYGIKPLVRTTGAKFAFASDALALVGSGLSDGAIDQAALSAYVDLHYLPPPLTGLADVQAVMPGEAVIRNGDGTERSVHWGQSTFTGSDSRSAGVALHELDEALGQAVRDQLVADVDVGIFLSSGIDSALLLSYAVSAGVKTVAFTVGFAGFGDYDEARRASEIALRCGVEHHVEQFDLGFIQALQQVSEACDVPLADASAVATLLLAHMARSTVTVALSGTGGDELFAGYYRHRAHRARSLAARLPEPARGAMGRLPASRAASRGSSLRLATSYLARLANAPSDDPASQYIELVGGATSNGADLALLFAVDRDKARREAMSRHWLTPGLAASPLDAVQEFDVRTYLPGDLLVKEDRATMRHSVEARVPFLDKAVVALARRIPPRQRASLLVGKRPLRRLARRRLGAAGLTWQKRGFAVPLAQLFREQWKREARDWFGSLESQLVDGGRVADALDSGTLDAGDAWALAVLGAWEDRVRTVGSRSRHAL